MRALRLLLLAGTAESRALAERLAATDGIAVVASLAGRTSSPAAYPCAVRTGGFGGVDGLVRYLAEERFDVVVDATHPFAIVISANAAAAAALAGLPLARLDRPQWRPTTGDDWTPVATAADAAAALPAGARVLLTLGGKDIAPFAVRRDAWFAVRTIEPPRAPFPLAAGRFVVGRPPFAISEETALFGGLAITHLVTRNSGGDASRAKLDSARALRIPVIMIDRPAVPAGSAVVFGEMDALRGWVEDLRDKRKSAVEARA